MMALDLRLNQYRGVNAHLHSILQTPGTDNNPSSWRGFHNHYVARLMESLNQRLPPGYIAVNDQSLQILGETDGGIPIRRAPIPDVSIYRRSASTTGSTQPEAIAEPTWEASIDETLAPDNTISAVVIYRPLQHDAWGKPVTRIELLSPSNKPGGENFPAYSAKRSETLLSGVPLIEIDYLHETPSPIPTLPVYPRDDDSHAYYIAVSDPRPKPHEGRVRVYGFDVDAPIPTLMIPLANQDSVVFDFGESYHEAYQFGPWHVLVDYTVLPVRFETYSAADQKRIRTRMETVR